MKKDIIILINHNLYSRQIIYEKFNLFKKIIKIFIYNFNFKMTLFNNNLLKKSYI